MLDLTVYAGAKSTTPHDQPSLTWDAFAAEVAALCREESAATDKRDLTAIGPYRLAPGATRSAAAVTSMAAMAALDLDGVDLDLLHARLTALGLATIVHGSPSDDTQGKRKARLFVRLDGPHAPEQCLAVRESVAAMLGDELLAGLDHPPAFANADRLFFCGRLRGTPERFCAVLPGKPLALASLPPAPVRVATAAPAASEGVVASPAYAAATAAVLAAVGAWHEHEGRKHAICGALGGVLRRAGWTRPACEQLVRAWLPSDVPGVDVAHGVAWAGAAWGELAEDVSGPATLAALIGAKATTVVEQSLMLPWRSRQDVPCDAPGAEPGEYTTLEAVDLSVAPPPLAYVVETLGLAPGKVSAVQGFACTAKTPFALQLATCVAAGVDFLGCAVRQTAVAYVDHEPSVLTQERAVRIRHGLALDVVPPLRYFKADQFSQAMLDDIEHAIDVHGVGMVVHDTYSSAVPADGNFNDSSFRAWADALGKLSSRRNVLVVVLLHETKAGDGGLRAISGHGSLAGALQAAIKLDRPDEADASLIRVSCARATRERFDAFDVRWTDVPCEAAPDGAALVALRIGDAPPIATRKPRAAIETADAARAAIEAAVAIMRDAPVTMTARKELVSLSGQGRAAAERALARLVGTGLMVTLNASYQRTPRGVAASSELAVRTALGAVAGFDR